MNHITIIGRLTRDPEIRWSHSDQPIAFGTYTLAVDRPVAKGKDPVTDFIFCKVVGKTAEFVEKYLRQGMKVAVEGRMQVDNYKDKDGYNRSTTYVQVASHEFCESKNTEQKEGSRPEPQDAGDGFMTVPEGIDEELPFN